MTALIHIGTVGAIALALTLTMPPGESALAQPARTSGVPSDSESGVQSGACAPWECGVSPARQARATKHYEQGNRMFEDSLFRNAALSYRSALADWDHPAIHYNLALAQIALDQTIPGYESLQQALRYDGDALGSDELKQARVLNEQLARKVTEVQVRCDQPGVVVTLDGKALLTGPGSARKLVLVGKHQLEASKRNHVTVSRTVDSRPKELTNIAIHLVAHVDATRSSRRWPVWVPWTVAVLGAGVATSGLVLRSRAADEYSEYTRLLAVQCPNGCTGYPPGLRDHYESAQWQQGLAVGAYVVGGLALVGGLWLAYRNRERIEENRELLQNAVRLTVTPVLSGDVRGLVASGSF